MAGSHCDERDSDSKHHGHIPRGEQNARLTNSPHSSPPLVSVGRKALLAGAPEVGHEFPTSRPPVWLVKTLETPGEHQSKWQMDVHPPQNGIVIGYATHGHVGKTSRQDRSLRKFSQPRRKTKKHIGTSGQNKLTLRII